jgi:hypothetical protein
MNYDDLLNSNSFISDSSDPDVDYVNNFRMYNENYEKYRTDNLSESNEDRVDDLMDQQRSDKGKKKRYTKHIISAVSIDSRDRDIGKYFKPNQYEIFLNKEFENVVNIRLLSVDMANPTQPVSINSNRIRWKCSSRLDFISDFNLQTDIVKYKDANFESVTTEYYATIPPGYYSTEGLARRMRERMNEVESYSGHPQFFHINIDTDEHVTTIISRFEELKISDISIAKDIGFLVITPLDVSTISEDWDAVTIILTDVPEIGGIPNSMINGKTFTGVTYVGGTLQIDLGILAVYTDQLTGLGNGTARFGKARNVTFRHLGVGNDADTNSDGVINTIFSVLGFPVPKGNLTVISEEIPLRPIHKNTDYLFEDYIRLATVAGLDTSFYNSEVHVLNIELASDGKYYFRSGSYIFLRIVIPKGKTGEIGGNITPTLSNAGSVERRNLFYQNPFQPTLKSEDSRLIKDINNIFAKINMHPIPGNMMYNTFTKSERIFYDVPLRRLGSFIIELVDSTGKIMDLRNEHSFTIEITEEIDVLEDTLMNTRNGDTSTSGFFIDKL